VALQVTSPGLTGTMTNLMSATPPAQIEFAVGSVAVDEGAGAGAVLESPARATLAR
jgi:hypothetical protein